VNKRVAYLSQYLQARKVCKYCEFHARRSSRATQGTCDVLSQASRRVRFLLDAFLCANKEMNQRAMPEK
jgi:hypothetical protein